MPGNLVEIKTNVEEFGRFIQRYADGAMMTFEAAFEMQARELCARLMKLTPPLSGKSIKRSLWSRDIAGMASYKALLLADNKGDMKAAFEKFSPFRDPDIEDMSARQVGERRVRKDIQRVIKPVRGAAMPGATDNPTIIVSQTNPRAAFHDVQIDWGIRQRCEGKDAIRVYADRSGQVYGVDAEKFMPNPSNDMLGRVHEAARGKWGRVTTAGMRDLVVGRWHWLNMVLAPVANVEAYIATKIKMVGQGRGGWAAGFVALGGKLSSRGWVGRHMKAGACQVRLNRGDVSISITNNSAWAMAGDPERIIENAMEGRERDMEKALALILERRWGAGAAVFDKETGRTTL